MLRRSKIKALMMAGCVALASFAGLAAAPADAATSDSGAFGWGGSLAPPMGWSSWSSLHGKISASIIEAQADVMHTSLQRYGYQYVNIDAGWFKGVDPVRPPDVGPHAVPRRDLGGRGVRPQARAQVRHLPHAGHPRRGRGGELPDPRDALPHIRHRGRLHAGQHRRPRRGTDRLQQAGRGGLRAVAGEPARVLGRGLPQDGLRRPRRRAGRGRQPAGHRGLAHGHREDPPADPPGAVQLAELRQRRRSGSTTATAGASRATSSATAGARASSPTGAR